MWLLTDCLDDLAARGFPPQPWQETTTAPASPPERRIASLLGAGPRLWRAGLANASPPGFWWGGLIVGDAPGSQFDALQAALDGELELGGPLACLALGGRGFRGQRQRPWAVDRGNLFLTVAFEPRLRAADIASALVMLPAVAVVDAIAASSAGAVDARIKWVNDILIDGRKVAGVLAASHCIGEELRSVVLGIGVNVEVTPLLESSPFVRAPICLADKVPGTRLGPFFWLLLEALGRRYLELAASGSGALFERYRSLSLVVGRRVRVWDESVDSLPPDAPRPEPRAQGLVRAIRPDLSLEIEGHPSPVARGRVELL